jgi:hypothetical protein
MMLQLSPEAFCTTTQIRVGSTIAHLNPSGQVDPAAAHSLPAATMLMTWHVPTTGAVEYQQNPDAQSASTLQAPALGVRSLKARAQVSRAFA